MSERFNLYSTNTAGADPYKRYNPSPSRVSASISPCSGTSSNHSSLAGTIAKGVVRTALMTAITGNPIIGAEGIIEAVVEGLSENV